MVVTTFLQGRSLLSSSRWLPLLAAAAVAGCSSTPEPPKKEPPAGPRIEIPTTEGTVRGYTQRDVHVFKGIRYGAPVAGLDRWLPTKPPPKHDDVFDATQFGPACEQTVAVLPSILLIGEATEVGYEASGIEEWAAEEKSPDCLRLNIWTPSELPVPAAPAAAEPAPVETEEAPPSDGGMPELADGGKAAMGDGGVLAAAEPEPAPAPEPEPSPGLAVIVKLHASGSENSGSASHKALDGERLARKGVVVVTINRRLGPPGFLAGDGLFEGDVLKGNRGVMDTVRALEWVRDNIANFGGDPNNVTLFGNSGGGTNVWSTLAAPASEGLVKRAILMSAPTYSWSLEDQKKLTKAVLEDWDVPVGDADALAKLPAEDVTTTIMSTTVAGSDEFGELSRTALPVAPTHGTDFLPDGPMAAIEKGRMNNIDLLVGNCMGDHKAATLYVPLPDSIAIGIWNGFIEGLVAETEEGYEEMTNKYVAEYPDDETLGKEMLQNDALYRVPNLKAATAHSKLTSGDDQGRTYVYQFNWKSPDYAEDLGAVHGLDMIFTFGNLHQFTKMVGRSGKIEASTQRLSDGMAEALANFAKTGTPSSDKLPEWPEYEAEKRQTMVFDVETKVESDPLGNLRKLWD